MLVVYLVLLLAAAVILGGVVVVAMGRGGELALFRRDLPALRIRLATPSDLARLRLPIGLLGYQEQATGDALRVVAHMLAERDAEIASLREELRGLGTQGAAGSPASPATPATGGGDVPSDTAAARVGVDQSPQS